MRIRNQLAACGGGFNPAEEITSEDYRDFCKFSYSPTATPVVDSVSPLSAQNGDTIEIHGSGFSQKLEENYVRFGDAECPITSSTNTMIRCTLSDSFAGPKPLYLLVSSSGIANASGIIMDYSLELESVTPNQGSIAGGTRVLVRGQGFYDSSLDGIASTDSNQHALHHPDTPHSQEDCRNVVTIGDNTCDVVQSSRTTITILTPAAEMNTMSAYDLTVTVQCSNGPQASSSTSQTLAGGYTYDTTLTPSLSGIHPTEGSIQGGDTITLFGSGFSNVPEQNTIEV